MTAIEGPTCRVLCVDDEPYVLDGLRRALHRRYKLVVSSSPAEALERVTASPDEFDVVMSDLKMPGTDGIALLAKLREVAPASVRILLTGHGDLNSAIDAVNRGHIFRFLTKPASRTELIDALDAAAEQHRLMVAERELLEDTLRGSVAALVETLALANPAAFARSGRVSRIVNSLAALTRTSGWEVEIAGMLSQIGAVTVGDDLMAKVEAGEELTADEQRIMDDVPLVSERLLASIPRLEEVRRIIRLQNRPFNALAAAADGGPSGRDLPIGARMLKVALDLDLLESRGLTREDAAAELARNVNDYDPGLLDRLADLDNPSAKVTEVTAGVLRSGMVVEADVYDSSGVLMVPRGRVITDSLLEVIVGYVARGRVTDRFTVSDAPAEG